MQCDLFTVAQTPNRLSIPERQKLVESVIPLCRDFAAKTWQQIESFAGSRLGLEDLESDCYVSAVQAAEKFDPARGYRFTTACTAYLIRGVRATIQEAFGHRVTLVFDDNRNSAGEQEPFEETDILPPNAEESLLLANLTGINREVVRLAVFEELQPEQVAQQVGIPVKDVRLIMRNSAKHLQGVKARQKGANLFVVPTVDSPESVNV